ncbi:MAG: ABC transporter substrate-binding protein [Peptostreptococcaceae bacterium]|nr:ABC transporter substrate-binding protein [Peptostreptococcaceae bacterium]
MKKFLALGFILIMVMALAACGGGDAEVEKEGAAEVETEEAVFEGPLKLADCGWDSNKFHNSVAGYIIENGFGVETEIVPGSSAAVWLGLGEGDVDVLMETWSDSLVGYDEDIASGKILEIGTNMDDNIQGFYVPTYVIEGDAERGIEPMAPDLKTVEDLKKYKDIFVDEEEPDMGRIYNSPPGWEVSMLIEDKFESYGLGETYNLFSPGLGASLAASIVANYEKGEPWVGYYWEPAWITGGYDLTLLDEGEYSDELWENGRMCNFKPVYITVTVQKELPGLIPDVTDFLSKYNLSSSQTAEALAYMNNNEASADEAALWFLNEHEEVWTEWLDDAMVQKIKDTL